MVDSLKRLQGDPLVQENLVPALRHLVLARRACPLLPRVHFLIGQLCVLVTEPGSGQIHGDRAKQVASWQPDLLYECGLMEYRAGRLDTAMESWRRSLTLGDNHLPEILRWIGPRLGEPGAAEKLLPGSPALLVRLAGHQFAPASQAGIRNALLERASVLTDEEPMPADERSHLQGAILALQGRTPDAIDRYRRATALRPQEPRWRYELALLLRQEGKFAEAHEQARLCAGMEPANKEYLSLLRTIHTRLLRDTSSLR
jgi:tetratricopeptide (TPR) repeat protein